MTQELKKSLQLSYLLEDEPKSPTLVEGLQWLESWDCYLGSTKILFFHFLGIAYYQRFKPVNALTMCECSELLV